MTLEAGTVPMLPRQALMTMRTDENDLTFAHR